MLTFNSCTKCVGSPGVIHDRMAICHPVPTAWMYGLPQKMNGALIRKPRWSLVYLVYFVNMLSMCVCTTMYCQTSGRLVQELNVCTVGTDMS